MSELSFLSIRDAGAGLRSGEFSVVELVDSVLERIETTNAVLQAFVEVLVTEARAEAKMRDEELREGRDRGPLYGIPIGVKDIYDVEGVPTRCGSRVREQVAAASHDAAVVRRLRDAGAIVVGKTTTQEFAAGVVSPPARNPWNPDRIPGGSSGGSAAALAVGAAVVGLGSDTGGSIRIPASVCGVVGLKPTFGLLSTDGVYPLAWSLDTVGPLARSVEDAAYAFDAIAGRRGEGSIASALKEGSKRVRVGVSRPHFFDRLQPGVAAAVESAIESLARVDGIDLIEVQWDDAGLARAAGFIINRVESSSVHYDGITRHPELYGEELRLRLEANALFPATGYLKALRARTRLRESIARFFVDHELDVMIAPTTPATAADASTLRVHYADESAEHVSLAYTRLTMPFNLTGQPALSLPCGSDSDGLPVGIQVVGRPYQEQALCQVGATIESALAGVVGAAWPRIPRIASQVHD